jgi:hypothetical protein
VEHYFNSFIRLHSVVLKHITALKDFSGRVIAQGVIRRFLNRGGPGSRPERSLWDLWWTKWHWDRFFSESFGFPLSVSFHRCSMFTHVSSGGWTKGPLAAQFSRDIVSPHRNTKEFFVNVKFRMREIFSQTTRWPSYKL